jgi:hypothetical protein
MTIMGLSLLPPALYAGDVAVLRNGFSIAHDHREQMGASTRLFLTAGDDQYIDVPSENIVEIQKDETPAPTPNRTGCAGTDCIDAACCVSAPATPTISASALQVQAPTINDLVEKAARENQLDSDFVQAVIHAESSGNVNAVSAKGAQGLMQLMPQTAAGLGVRNSFDPGENIGAGTSYLRALLARYHNDPIRALAAYNAGAGRVQQYGGVPPFYETQAYVARVIREFNRRKLEQSKLNPKKPRKPALTAANHSPKAH